MMQRLQRPSYKVWTLLAGTGLLAMAFGHAIELWLERRGLFGDAPAAYMHSAQSICIELGIFAVLLSAFFILRHILANAFHPVDALRCSVTSGISQLGRVRTTAYVIAIQFVALAVVELSEQALSGVDHPSLGAVFGAGHTSAALIHLAVGSLLALVIYAFAVAVSTRSRGLAASVSRFLRPRLLRALNLAACAFRRLCVDNVRARVPLLSLGLANRPPPRATLA